MSVSANVRTKTRWGVKHKVYDGNVVAGWQNTLASELGDYQDSLIIIFNDGASGLYFNVQACADINDADWYQWPSGFLAGGSGYFTSLQWPWGAVRVRLNSPNTSQSTVWVNTRLRT